MCDGIIWRNILALHNMPNMQPVVFALANGLTNGGVTTWALGLSKRLNAAGYPATLISHSAHHDLATFTVLGRDDVVYCDGSAWDADASAIDRLMPVYSSLEPGVFIPNWSWGTYATVAKMSLRDGSNLRVLGFAHSDEDHYYELLAYYEPIIAKFIAVSDTIYDNLRRLLPSRTDDIEKLSFAVPAGSARKPRNRSGPLLITYAGRIQQREKRIFDLIELARRLACKNGEYHIHVAGDGADLPRLKDFFDQNKFANVSVDFLGLVPHEEMSGLWASSDVSVLFSDVEGLSLSMLESMGQGCVPVVTDVSGSREAIAHGESGFIVPVGDVDSMAHILCSLEANRELLEKISSGCISTIRARHSVEGYDQDFMNIVQQATEKPPARWSIDKVVLPRPKPSSVYQRGLAKVRRLVKAVQSGP